MYQLCQYNEQQYQYPLSWHEGAMNVSLISDNKSCTIVQSKPSTMVMDQRSSWCVHSTCWWQSFGDMYLWVTALIGLKLFAFMVTWSRATAWNESIFYFRGLGTHANESFMGLPLASSHHSSPVPKCKKKQIFLPAFTPKIKSILGNQSHTKTGNTQTCAEWLNLLSIGKWTIPQALMEVPFATVNFRFVFCKRWMGCGRDWYILYDITLLLEPDFIKKS